MAEDTKDYKENTVDVENTIVPEEIERTESLYKLGEEVVTNQIWFDGKPVYRIVVNFGALPNTDTTTVDIGNTGTIDKVVNIRPIYTLDGVIKAHVGNKKDSSEGATWKINDNDEIQCLTDWNASTAGWTAYVLIEYTKV